MDEIFERLSAVIKEAQLDYIKWDMNRPLTDVFDGGHAADADGLLRGGRAAGLSDSGGVGEGGGL